MLPKTHTILGFVVSLVLFIIFPITWWQAGIIFLSSVLIDIDHYLLYVKKNKDWSLKRAYIFFIKKSNKWKKLSKLQKEKYKHEIIFFHGIEFIIILVLLIFLSNLFLFILIGILIHLALDFIDLIKKEAPLHVKSSQIYTHLNNKGKKDF